MEILIVSNRQNYLEDIRMFLAGGGNPNHTDQFGDTLLHVAAKWQNSVEIVEELVIAGASINTLNFLGRTPLHIAVLHRNRSVVSALISYGAKVYLKDCSGNSVLHSAISTCSTMDEDGNCNNPYCTHRVPDMDIIGKLLDQELMDVNKTNLRGYTPLFLAAKAKNPEIVKALLAKFAMVDVCNKCKETPLHAALSYPNPHLDIASQLLFHGASFSFLDSNNQTPFDRVFNREKGAESEKFLLDLVPLVTFFDTFYSVFLFMASTNDKLQRYHKKCFEEVENMQRVVIRGNSLYDLIFQRLKCKNLALLVDAIDVFNSDTFPIYHKLVKKYI